MKTEEQINKLIEKCNSEGRNKTFAEFICELFKDQLIEIYLGDEYESISTEQVSTPYPAVFCGKVISAYKECLILNSAYYDSKIGKVVMGNLIFINERAIRGLNELDGNGNIKGLFLNSEQATKVFNSFGK